MRLLRYIIPLLLLASMVMGVTAAQENKKISDEELIVRAYLTPDSLMIGDRITMRVEVTKDLMSQIAFPEFGKGNKVDSLFIEVLEERDVDTIRREGRIHTISKEYDLICFDAGRYSMGRFPVIYINRNEMDTVWSIDSLSMRVYTYNIDTTTQTIVDIIPPMHTPLKIGEFSGYLIGAILFIAIIVGIILLVARFLSRRKAVEQMPHPESAHLKAIKALEVLHSQKLWQAGQHKRYYTALSDIIREYIEDRFGFGAMEKTSEEILSTMNNIVEQRAYDRLKSLLSTSDYVKFAKYMPDAEQNEQCFNDAYYFVEDTKFVEQEPTEHELQVAEYVDAPNSELKDEK